MRLRRCFCLLLCCVVICSGLSSVSVSAAEIDGFTVETSWAFDGEYVDFNDTITVTGALESDSLYIMVDIFPASVIKKDTVFNFSMSYNAGTANEWHCAYLAMYGSDNKLISSTQDITVSDGSVSAQDVQAASDVHQLKVLLKANSPLWMLSGSGGSGEDSGSDSGSTPPVTFTINGRTYYADSEQKWVDWINTEYNTDGIKKGSSSITSAGGYGLQLNGSYLTTYDSIINGASYTYSGSTFVGYNGSYFPDIDSVWTDKNTYPYATIVRKTSTSSVYYLFLSQTKCTGTLDKISYPDSTLRHSFSNGNNEWGTGTVQGGASAYYPVIWTSYDYYDADGNLILSANGSSGSGSDSGSSGSDPSTWVNSFDFSVTSVSVGEDDEKGLLSGIIGWIKNIYNSIVSLPQNFANSISGFFDNVVNSVTALGDKLLEGIKGLFVPSEEAMEENHDKWTQLLEDRFGAVYESTSIIDDFASAFQYSGDQTSISFPSITVNLAGTPFSFGGWNVDVITGGFEAIITSLKMIVNVVCTFLFIMGMKKRLEGLLS